MLLSVQVVLYLEVGWWSFVSSETSRLLCNMGAVKELQRRRKKAVPGCGRGGGKRLFLAVAEEEEKGCSWLWLRRRKKAVPGCG